ncbi:MAG: class I SAM-dependent methyltransferase [Myxococcota bacterium]
MPLLPDQVPEGWNDSSEGYDANVFDFMQPYVRSLLERAAPGPDHDVLDVAAGTGAVTAAVAPSVRRVVAADFAERMLDLLRRRVEGAGLQNVETRLMDCQRLELDDGSFDVVCSNFGVIFFPDRRAGFSEMRRVLRPDGGRAAMTAWSTPDRFELFGMFARALDEALPDRPQPPAPPPLFSLADPGLLEHELREAGFAEVRVDTVSHDYEVADADEFWSLITKSAPPAQALLQKVGPEGREKMRSALADLARDRFGDGPLRFSNEAHVAVAFR